MTSEIVKSNFGNRFGSVRVFDSCHLSSVSSGQQTHQERGGGHRRNHAENQRISSLHSSLDVVNDQLQEALRSGANKDRIIEDKTRRIREKDEEIIQLYNKLLMCRQSKIRAKS